MIPLELITGGAACLTSFIGSVIAMKIKQRAAEQRLLLGRHSADEASRTRAEANDTPEKRWTRRTIALSVTAAVIVLPVLLGAMGISITTGWTELQGGFWPFTDPKSVMIWHTVSGGIVITPLHTHTMSAIIGFYFGSSIAENARV